jgi:hypothetical protein
VGLPAVNNPVFEISRDTVIFAGVRVKFPFLWVYGTLPTEVAGPRANGKEDAHKSEGSHPDHDDYRQKNREIIGAARAGRRPTRMVSAHDEIVNCPQLTISRPITREQNREDTESQCWHRINEQSP